jgi:uncharacterized membrane protein
MKAKQILLNVLAVVMAFEFIGISMLCMKHPSWGGLWFVIVSAMVFVMVFNKAHFYKYQSR